MFTNLNLICFTATFVLTFHLNDSSIAPFFANASHPKLRHQKHYQQQQHQQQQHHYHHEFHQQKNNLIPYQDSAATTNSFLESVLKTNSLNANNPTKTHSRSGPSSSPVILNYTWPVKKVCETDGDIILGGLMMVHEREDSSICGQIMPQGGIQALECMLYTVDWINNQTDFLPGLRIGTYILDDCDKDTYGLEQAVDFIKGSISNIDDTTYRCTDGSSPEIKQKVISGVLGAASSVTSIQVANLLRLFKIPQVSFFSTSPELSNKQRFEYFLRTVPSDINQAQAMVEIIKLLNWTYVSVIYEESNYGIKAFGVLEDQLARNGICLAVKEKLTKDSGVANKAVYDYIVNKLLSKPSARGVIIFGSDQEVAQVMEAVKRNNATGYFLWIGSDGWSARNLVSDGNELEVEGTISIQPMAHSVPGFDDYFLSLTPENNIRNPWFIEYWEHYFKCKWSRSQVTPFNQNYTNLCTGKEVMSYDNGYEPEKQLQFVSDAVLAFAYAFKALHKDVCHGKPGLCAKMMPIEGSVLLKYLKKVRFRGMTGDDFKFTEDADGPVRYNLIHFKQVTPGDFQWVPVGTYVDERLNLDLELIQFHFNQSRVPESVCSLPCGKGQAKKYIEGENCCWHCFNCTIYQVLTTETECQECPNGFLPDSDQRYCVPIPEQYIQIDNPLAVIATLFSCFGIIFTLLVILVFVKYRETPVIRASGRELCLVLLIGLIFCYSLTFLLLLKPTNLVCGLQQLSIGMTFALIYSAILTKTNRIFRIFTSGKKSAKKPNFISPKSQLIICFGLSFGQFIILLLWFAFSPPKAIHVYFKREDNQLICSSNVSDSYFVAFLYPMALIIVCTIYAILSRKIPEAFNESKHIGFTMYTTCIIWLAFIPIYFTTKTNVSVNLTTMSIAINFSATITLICLFSPKVYIVLFHPEKNVRQSLMVPLHRGNENVKRYCSTNLTTTGAGQAISSFGDNRSETDIKTDALELKEVKAGQLTSKAGESNKVDKATQTMREDIVEAASCASKADDNN